MKLIKCKSFCRFFRQSVLYQLTYGSVNGQWQVTLVLEEKTKQFFIVKKKNTYSYINENEHETKIYFLLNGMTKCREKGNDLLCVFEFMRM